jgi:pantetheine-phosphate adenylyltransferase
MMRIALFPGSFDPITKGHYDIISRALPLFDKIIVAVGKNATKSYMFDLHTRIKWIEQTFAGEEKIEVASYSGLTVDYAKEVNANFLLRGVRNPADFEFEKAVAQANRQMLPDLDTVFLLTSARYAYISSSIVRDVLRNDGDYTLFVPPAVRVKNRQ